MAPKRITGQLFKGSDCLTHDQWRELEVVNSTDGPRRLMQNWGGGMMGYLCGRLENDNRRIANLNFHLLGMLGEDTDGINTNCNKFWDVEENMKLHIAPFDTKVFQFKSGTLVSELLDSSALETTWTKDGAPLSEQDRLAAGIKGFSLRFFVMPNQPTWASVSILLFPIPKAELQQTFPLSSNPSFPGMTLYSAKFCSLGFAADQVFKNHNFGTPLLPCIIPGGEWDALPTNPTTPSLLQAIAKTLRATWKPVGKANAKALKKKWDELALAGESALKEEAPAFIWPEPSPRSESAPQGRVSVPPPFFPFSSLKIGFSLFRP